MKTRYMRNLPDHWDTVARVCIALGDSHRQRILLLFEPRERLNIKQICEIAPLSRTAVSHHLRVLKKAGILKSEKEGKEVYFWIDKFFVKYALETLLDFVQHEY